MIELLQFRFSPYNEKVRWALDLKRVPHRRRSLLPGPHMRVVKPLTGRTSTPVLLADGEAIDGSTRIIEWLEARWPEPRLLPADATERAEALEWVRRFDEDIAPRGRRTVLAALLQTPRYFADVFGDGRSDFARRAYSWVVPVAAPLIRKGNGITGDAAVADGLKAFDDGMDAVAARVQGRDYLVGNRFGIADLAVASTLAICVDPPDSPMTRPRPVAAPMAAFFARYAAHPAAAWVRGIYARHRHARADFDGDSAYR